jgi:translation initiation factor IF-2
LKKVRVSDIAKDLGMKGPELVKLLRDMGFDGITSHQKALDPADEMMVLARLEAHGLKKKPAEEAAGDGKPKKKLLPSAADSDVELEAGADAAAQAEPDALAKKPLKKDKELKELPAKKTLPSKPLTKKPMRSLEEAAKAAEPETTAPAEDVVEATVAEVAPAPKPHEAVARAPQVEAEPAQPAAAQLPAQEPAVEIPAAAVHVEVPVVEAPAAVIAEPIAAEAPVAPTVAPAPVVEAAPIATPAAAPIAAPTPATARISKPALTPTSAVAKAGGPAIGRAPQGAPTGPGARAPQGAPGARAPQGAPGARVPLMTPAAQAAPAAPAAQAIPADAPDSVRKLLIPQKKATVVGRIELPQETIRDARSRSAPNADLRRAALQKTQGQRSATRPPVGGGMQMRRGPAGPGQRPGSRDQAMRGPKKSRIPTTIDPDKEIEVTPPVSIKGLSEALGIKVTDLIATLTFKLQVAGKNINSYLSQDEVELVAMELDRKVLIVEHKHAEEEMIEKLVEDAAGEQEILRAPVVTFMGHVDHGKTSLMDALRNTDIAKGEAGGITQHIGAYKVTSDQGSFVILDTPGHAAFTSMRARGAQLTDIVVIVVAADDGVMPQTEEAINHAKAAKVPMVVAITKCDLPQANTMQVKQQLMVKGLQAEEWGGTTGIIEVSSTKRTGLENLIERIMLESEVLELKSRPDAPGRGIVVESKQSPEQGVVVTVLVTDGTLRIKDSIVCGESFSRVRAMIDDHGRQLTEAPPSTPVTVFGLDRLPMPGDKLFAVEDAKKAREVVEDRQRRIREQSLAERSAVTLETLSAKLAEKNMQEIKLILKADAMGSLEPLRKCLDELKTAEVRVNLVHSALGGINETDVSLAEASGAVIVGFHTVADSSARQAAERAGVEIRYYDVIYELLDNVRAAMEGLLKPEEVESILGHAEVRAVFKSSKFGTIAGCYITDGVCKRNAKVRLSREGRVVYSGKVASLRREKDDARDVRAGFECGITLQDYQDLREGDILEFAQVDLVRRTL